MAAGKNAAADRLNRLPSNPICTTVGLRFPLSRSDTVAFVMPVPHQIGLRDPLRLQQVHCLADHHSFSHRTRDALIRYLAAAGVPIPPSQSASTRSLRPIEYGLMASPTGCPPSYLNRPHHAVTNLNRVWCSDRRKRQRAAPPAGGAPPVWVEEGLVTAGTR
jgi:hypothetical protein